LYPEHGIYDGAGSLAAIALHLSREHGVAITSGELNMGPEEGDEARKRYQHAIDQIFSCTNSPAYQQLDDDTKLCSIQEVAVIVNRLRDNRIAYELGELVVRGGSGLQAAGWPHTQAIWPGLITLAEARGMKLRDISQELGLRAIRSVMDKSELQ
jgi:hypothetical protein